MYRARTLATIPTMTTTLEKKLATLAILLFAYKTNDARRLTDGVDMSVDMRDVVERLMERIEELEPGEEFGTQALIPMRILNKLEYCYTACQPDHSARTYEVNAIISKK